MSDWLFHGYILALAIICGAIGLRHMKEYRDYKKKRKH